MHVQLLVPDLIASIAGLRPDVRLDAAEALLAKGRRTATTTSTEDWLAARYELEQPSLAAFSLLGDGGTPGGGCWLRADPVHLRVDRDTLVLADSSVFALGMEEASALVASLNAHFAPMLEIHAHHPNRWYARLQAPPQSRFRPLAAARGQPITAQLPRGEDGMHWHALMNEAQMLLHDHPVNEAREARGELPVNSIWLWGEGRGEGAAPAVDKRPFRQVLTNDAVARGFGLASGASVAPLPADAATWLAEAPGTGTTLIVLDALRAPAAYDEAEAWQTTAQKLERDWFAPLLAALRAGHIGMLTLNLLADKGGVSAETVRLDLNRFWRRRKPLSHYICK